MRSNQRSDAQPRSELVRMEAIFSAIVEPVIVVNAERIIERANLTAAGSFGYSKDALEGISLSELFPDLDTNTAADANAGSESFDAWLLRKPVGEIRIDACLPAKRLCGTGFFVRVSTIGFEVDHEILYVMTISDLTEQRLQEVELVRYIHDLESAKAQTEYQAEQISNVVEDLAAEKDRMREQTDQLRLNEKELFDYVRDLEMTRGQFEKQASDMAWLAEQLNREKNRVEESRRVIEHQAHHDPLTQLGNRALLSKVLSEMLEEARANGTHVGFICIDLDNFKAVNDRLGHESGDLLLCKVADVLRANIRANDAVIRQGGDEFAVAVRLGESRNETDLRELAERIRAALSISVEGPDGMITTGASLGIAIFPEDGLDTHAIRTAADDAMYRAKRAGKGRVE